MSTYFDPIMQQETLIDESTIAYLVKVGDNKFSIKAISSGLELLPSDPTTHATDYWPVPIELLMSQTNNNSLFEGDQLTNQAISKEQVIELFKVDPDETQPKQFSTSVKEELNDTWVRGVMQDEFAGSAQNQNFFFFRPVFQPPSENNSTQQTEADSLPQALFMVYIIRTYEKPLLIA